MKKIFLLFCFFAITANSQTQNCGKITYSFIANGKTMQTFLIFNESKSIFNTLMYKTNEALKVATKENANEDANEINITMNPYKYIPEDLGLLTNLETNIIIDNKYYPKNVNGKLYDTLFVKDSARIIKWKITNETKQINTFSCYKAIGDFRGRTYHVWFTPEISVSFGPWKLNGLPGLILEASDTKNQYMYYADKIELNKETIKIDSESFQNKNYITPKKEMEIFLINMDEINNEITQKIRSSLPRGVNSTSTKKTKHSIDPESLIEFNFDDIKSE